MFTMAIFQFHNTPLGIEFHNQHIEGVCVKAGSWVWGGEKQPTRANTMTYQVNPLPAGPASQVDTGPSPSFSTSNPVLC